ncbi:hypothetical protein L5515_015436 [Caenorhabditis briggsae]|uniref:Uncharacterized protein n=1 Tax=Caenorhabditis briggsae TaxID=6238 RepID=A0AAE9EBT5_CAEBR|nr:hypothetical protein L5515_015436 [Caenorhabditis briggsae]
MMARTSIVSGPTPEQTKEDLKAVIEQKDLQIVELKKQLNLSYLHVAELEESHRKAKVQGYKQGLAENSRLVSYFERKATKLMGRLIEYEDVKEDLFTGDIESDEEGVAARGSEEKQYARRGGSSDLGKNRLQEEVRGTWGPCSSPQNVQGEVEKSWDVPSLGSPMVPSSFASVSSSEVQFRFFLFRLLCPN